MDIAMLYLNNPPFLLETHEQRGLGGSENGFLRTCAHLLRGGHRVAVFNRAGIPPADFGAGLRWADVQWWDPKERFDVVYSLRHREVFEEPKLAPRNAGLRVLFLADTESRGLGDAVRTQKIDLVMAVSHWQKEKISTEEHLDGTAWLVTSNGVEAAAPVPAARKVEGRCLFTATPERGLATLLAIWPEIKAAVPWATLHVYSSFQGWGISPEESERMCESWYAQMRPLEPLGVVNQRHAPAAAIRRAQEEAELYLYPSDFYETCCMSVLEAMLAGALPVVTGRAGLLEKVLPGVTGAVVPAYGEGAARYREAFVAKTVELLALKDLALLARMRQAAYKFASQFTYQRLVPGWAAEWERRLREKGWWK